MISLRKKSSKELDPEVAKFIEPFSEFMEKAIYGKTAKTRKAENDSTKNSVNTESNKSKANEMKDTTSSANPYIRDEDPNKINLGFGVEIDTGNQDEQPIQQQTPVINLQDYANQQQAGQFQYQQPQQQFPNQPFYPEGFARQPGVPSDNANAYLNHIIEQAKKRGNGRHKVDYPTPPKPKVEKSDEDKSIAPNCKPLPIDVEVNERKLPDTIQYPVPNAEPITQEEQTPVFDNSALKEHYLYLEEIEKEALKHNIQVQMIPMLGPDGNPNGLINVLSYIPGSQINPSPYKSFTIDTGCIIDKRVKMFPTVIPSGYENFQAYPVFVSNKDRKENKNEKTKNVFNNKLFSDFFVGGIENLGERDGMYSPTYLELNRSVALITTPTKNMKSESRKNVKTRLIEALKAGVFEKAKESAPTSRWRFKSYDDKTGTFTLTNEGVPRFFGEPCTATQIVEINFGVGQTTVNPIVKQ